MSRTHSHSWPWLAMVVVGLCLVPLTSCGGDSTAGDEERVKASLLRLSDLPTDEKWEIEEETEDAGLEEVEEELDACERRHDPTAQSAEAEQESDSFTNAELDSVSSSGWVVPDGAQREAFFDSLDAQFLCVGHALARYLRSEMPAGGAVEVAAPTPLDVETDADRSAGRAIQVGITHPGGKRARATLFLDVLAVEEGSLLAGYVFLHSGGITLEEEADVVDRAIGRVREQ